MTVFDTIPHYDFGDGTLWAAPGYAVNNGKPNYLAINDGDYIVVGSMSLPSAMAEKGFRYLRFPLPGPESSQGAELPNVLQRAYVGVYPNGRVEPLFGADFTGKDKTNNEMGWTLSDVSALPGYWTKDGNCYVATLPQSARGNVGNFVPWGNAFFANIGDYTQAPNGQFQWLQPDSDGYGSWIPMPGGIGGTFQAEFCRLYWHREDAGMTLLDKAMPIIILSIATAGIAAGISAAAAETAAAEAVATSSLDAGVLEAGTVDTELKTTGASAGVSPTTITATITKGVTTAAGKDFITDTLDKGGLNTNLVKFGGATSLTPSTHPEAPLQPRSAPVATGTNFVDSLRTAAIVFSILDFLGK